MVKTGSDSVSVVVPLFNEETCVDELHRRLKAVMDATGRQYELVLVNDGSRDGTLARLERIQQSHGAVKLVDLSRNSGQTAALAAGFANAVGDIVIPMDGDLQHLPEEIPLFLAKVDEGFDIVSGWRQGRKEAVVIRLIPSWIANRMMALLSGIRLHDFGTTFKAYRRDILDRLTLYGDFHRFIPVLAKPLKARMCEVPIAAPARVTGASKYGISRVWNVFFDILRIKFLITFLSRPLSFFGTLGGGLMTVGGVMGVILIWNKFVNHMSVMAERGPFFIAAVFVLLAGLQLLSIGFLGEMLTRVYHESNRTRIYSVRSVRGRGLSPEE